MSRTILFDQLSDCFDTVETPDWYSDAIAHLRGNADRGLFGLFLYNLIRNCDEITEIVNIGTARGHSAVCAAKGLEAAGRSGTVHTIDVIDPDAVRPWHDTQPESDPLRGVEISMRDLIGRFMDPSTNGVDIEFHTGDSNDIIPGIQCSPDLVFHDGLHTYSQVLRDVEATQSISNERSIHVFDDCYLYTDQWVFRPFTAPKWYDIDGVPRLGGLIRRLRGFSLSRTRFPGVTLAVSRVIDESDWESVEILRDPDHAPITALFPG